MTDERLYIDGVLVDTDEDTKITMDIKSNLFRDVSKIASNTTNVEPDVLNERSNVLLTPLLIFSYQVFFGKRVTFSRTRSKITTVLLIE